MSRWENDCDVRLKSNLIGIRLEGLTNDDCGFLTVPAGTIGLNLSQVFREENSRPVSFSEQGWRGDVAEFLFALDYKPE